MLKQLSQPLTPTLTFDTYAKVFDDFRSRSDEWDRSVRWFQNCSDIRHESVQAMLSIGAGTGAFDCRLIPSLPRLKDYHVIEPNPVHLETFRQHSATFKHIDFQFIPKPFASFKPKQTYDLILLSHSLYYVTNQHGCLRDLYNTCLSPGGQVLIFHQTESGIFALQTKMEMNTYHYSATDIKGSLDKLSLPYTYVELDSSINISQLPTSLIHFFLEKEVSGSEEKAVRNYLAPFGTRLPHPCGTFLVTKPGMMPP